MTTMKFADETIVNSTCIGNCGDNASSIQLVSGDADRYLNIYVKPRGTRSTGYICASADMAKRLRDALLLIYPVEAPKATEAAPKRRPRGAQEYKGNGKHEWERVTEDTMRLRVPGGWLYSDDVRTSITFVPTPEVVGYAI